MGKGPYPGKGADPYPGPKERLPRAEGALTPGRRSAYPGPKQRLPRA